ncbi:MAG: hypothetical protein AB8E82_04255 [Aureispira sp.]
MNSYQIDYSTAIFILFLFLLNGIPDTSMAQNAYDHWLKSQELETHMRYKGNYSIKETYKSATGKRKDLQLTQQQYYKSGYLREDILYTYKKEKLYHVRFQLPASYTWDSLAQQGGAYLAGLEMVGFNVVDSSTTTYAFEESGKLKYYVVDQQGSLHVVYTYDEQGQLLRYKDCLAPFGNSYWCAYYVYEYNDKKQLTTARSYNLGQDQTPEQKDLFAVDSMVYNEQGLLIERWTLDNIGTVTQKAVYNYNEKEQLCQEISLSMPISELSKKYKKTMCYQPNGHLKKQQEAYYFGDRLEIRQERLFNTQGNLVSQATYKQAQQPINLYIIKYKK